MNGNRLAKYFIKIHLSRYFILDLMESSESSFASSAVEGKYLKDKFILIDMFQYLIYNFPMKILTIFIKH